jgi:hypothetical protein
MTPKVSHYLNRTVMVSVPALFDDGACRPFTLLGTELNGLWLQSEELTRRLLPEDKRGLAATTSTAVFVPFAQIAGVLVAAGPATDPQQEAESSPPAAPTRGRMQAGSAPNDSGAVGAER